MRDVYKDDFCDVARDGSSLALQVSYLKFEPRVSDIANTTTKKLLTYEKKLNKLKELGL